MKYSVIQSLWYPPILDSPNKNDLNNRFDGGWPSNDIHLKSIAVSNSCLNMVYGSASIFCDQIAYEALSESNLNFCNLYHFLPLNQLRSRVPLTLWAAGKLLVYQSQNNPFIHFDNDVFISSPIEIPIFDQPTLIVQNTEENFPGYLQIFKEAKNSFVNIPNFVEFGLSQPHPIAINAGILGMTHPGAFTEFFEIISKFIEDNFNVISKYESGEVNQFIEQFCIYWYSTLKNIKIYSVFSDISSDYSQVMAIHDFPHSSMYIHAVGTAKMSSHIHNFVAGLLASQFYSSETNTFPLELPLFVDLDTSDDISSYITSASHQPFLATWTPSDAAIKIASYLNTTSSIRNDIYDVRVAIDFKNCAIVRTTLENIELQYILIYKDNIGDICQLNLSNQDQLLLMITDEISIKNLHKQIRDLGVNNLSLHDLLSYMSSMAMYRGLVRFV